MICRSRQIPTLILTSSETKIDLLQPNICQVKKPAAGHVGHVLDGMDEVQNPFHFKY